MGHTLFIYRNLIELRRLQEEREVFAFIFGQTKEMLDIDSEICIDISALVHFLITNKNSIEPAYANFINITEETTIIAEAAVAENAIGLLPHLLTDYKFYYDEEEKKNFSSSEVYDFKPFRRQKIYKYNNTQELDTIIRYAETNDIPIATFSQASGEQLKEFEQFNKNLKLAMVDLTSISYAIEGNKALIYLLEQFLNSIPNIKVIAKTTQVDILLQYYPLFFDGQESIGKLIPALSDVGIENNEEKELTKVTHLHGNDFEAFIDTFNHNLIGHNAFKNRLRYALKNFISLNRVKDQKILSIFLFGESGIGKTEVARLMANGLKKDCYLAKINFQNYSSQDALNSLIGSPAGYVGCNNGELSEKIQKSKVGVLLCDEFEKTTRPVYSFFLELLEEGRFTDSMAREYDMDGYIIIFTSNIHSEEEYRKSIPSELQTRFDLVCEFEEPTTEEKTEFLDLLLESAKTKYHEEFAKAGLTEIEIAQLYAFDYSSLAALRDIKRVFNNRLMDLFAEKGVLQ